MLVLLSTICARAAPTSTPTSAPTDIPPPPNPWTLMTTVVVPGAAAAGAIYPDSSPANFELNFTGSPGWIVHLSGGGWRFLQNTTNGTAAESKVPPALTGDGSVPSDVGCYGHCDGIMSTDPTQNPLFHSWNKVFVPISGTSFTGNRDSLNPYPVRGARILQAVIAHLQAQSGMAHATDVILTGGSSGGLATYLTCDRVGELVSRVNASTRYSCLADAGFFLDHPNYEGQPSYSPLFEQSFYAWNSSGGTNQACIAHYARLGTPEKCIFAQYVAPFIQSDLFIMQTLYDSFQLANILQVTGAGKCAGYGSPGLAGCQPEQISAIQQYGSTTRTLLASLAAKSQRLGVYAPSCISHCQSVENEHPAALWDWPARWGIGNATPSAAFNDWYSNRKSNYLVQQCDWSASECNAKCPMYT